MDSFIAFDLKARKYFNIMVYTLTLLMDLVNMIDNFAPFDLKAHKYFNIMMYTRTLLVDSIEDMITIIYIKHRK